MVASVAVLENNKILGEFNINHKRTHSQKLMPMIKEVLSSLELSVKDIELFAASVGPGSFTGLRIGVTTIKAFGYAQNKPVIGIPTLDALAYNIFRSDSIICPILDARNNQVYTSLYIWKDNEQVKIHDTVGIYIKELVEILKSLNKRVVFLGDGVEIHEGFLNDELKEKCDFALSNSMFNRASSVGNLALKRYTLDQEENYLNLVPFYLRKSQAERMMELQQREGI